MTIYRVELFFSVDPDRPDLDIGRELRNAVHNAIGGDQELHAIATECGARFSGTSWEEVCSGPSDDNREMSQQ